MAALKKKDLAGCQWLTPVILPTQGQRSGGLWFEDIQGKQLERPYLENTQHKKGFAERLKW
jgi:hypothetical protein